MDISIPKWLVIGYGSELHGDDGAGPAAVRAIDEWRPEGVRTKIVHQLTPEIAEILSHARSVLFIDASTAVRVATLRPVEPDASDDFNPHASSPESILALSKALYDRCPSAWLAAIPASNFELGAPLSEATAKGISDALVVIRKLLVP
jgi:hydrogenase maturation protease